MSNIQAITYDDGVVLTAGGTALVTPVAAFMCDTAGTVVVVTAQGTSLTLKILASLIYPIAILKVTSGSGVFTGFKALPYKGQTS